MAKVKATFVFIITFFIIFNCVAMAAERQTVMYKQKMSFGGPTLEVENPYDYISIVIKCVDCRIYDKVIRNMEADRWTREEYVTRNNIGVIWIDSTNQIDVMVNGVDPGIPYSIDSFVQMLNKKIFISGSVSITKAVSVITTSLSKKIIRFKQSGEYYVPEIVNGYEYLRVDVYADEQKTKKKKREIMIAHKNIVNKLQATNLKDEGKLAWRKEKRGNQVAVIQLYYEADTLNVIVDVFGGKARDLRYESSCKSIIKYLSRDIRAAGHTGIKKDGTYIDND